MKEEDDVKNRETSKGKTKFHLEGETLKVTGGFI
jgi:hypothetical protein